MGLNDTCCSNRSGIYLSADGRQIISRETTQGSCIALRAWVGVVSAVAGIVVAILLAVVIFRYQRIGGPWYKLLASGEAKTELRRAPTQQPPYELESMD
jgi:hypothetical protein